MYLHLKGNLKRFICQKLGIQCRRRVSRQLAFCFNHQKNIVRINYFLNITVKVFGNMHSKWRPYSPINAFFFDPTLCEIKTIAKNTFTSGQIPGIFTMARVTQGSRSFVYAPVAAASDLLQRRPVPDDEKRS